MDSEILKGNWKELKGLIRKEWNKLSENEIDQIEGNYDQLVGRLRQRYGLSVEEGRQRVNEFIARTKRQAV